jgi:hypothetical protein
VDTFIVRHCRRLGWQRFFLTGLLVALVLPAVGQKSLNPSSSEREPESARLVRLRQRWFYRQRAYPLPRIPAFARLHALEQLRRMIRARQRSGFQPAGTVQAPADPSLAWTSIGPQPTNSLSFSPFVSGRVTALVVDPRDSTGNTIFLGAAEGGVWKSTDGGGTWMPLTDQEPSLAVGSLALDPSTSPSTIYVGTGEENFAIDSYYGAGVLKSTDGGATWARDNTFFNPSQPLDVNRAGPMIGAMAVQPVTAATTPKVLLAAVQGSGSALQSGVWRSTDGGMTWTHVLPGPIRVVATDVAFDPNDSGGQTTYAALGNTDASGGLNGVYKSTDAGQTWTQLTLPVSSSSMGRIALTVGPPASGQTTGEIFAAIASASSSAGPSSDLLGMFKSTDGGNTWTESSAALVAPSDGFCNDQCFYDLAIRVSPTNPNLVFAGGAALHATLIRSTDGGSTWSEVSGNRTSVNGLHVDVHALAFALPSSSLPNGALYAGNDGGVWSTADPTAGTIAWNNLNSTLAITQFYPGLSAHPSNFAFRSFGGTQDNGTQRFSGNLAWDNTGACGDGTYTAIDPATPSTVYATCAFVSSPLFFNLVKSFFNGDSTATSTSFLFAGNGIDASDNGNFIPPLVMDPENPSRLYFGTFRVWQTADGADSWNAISPDLTGGCTGDGVDCISTIAVAPTDANTILVGTGKASTSTTGTTVHAVIVTTSGGVTWSDVSAGLPARFVTRVAVDPRSSTALYATFSGFSGFDDTLGHVFQGQLAAGPSVVWTDISAPLVTCSAGSGALPNIPVNDIVIDPDIAGTLYVATDIGGFQGTLQAGGTAGACWQPLGSGLPNVAVLSLVMHHASRTLLAGTHGRSVWELPLGGLPAFHLSTISPASDDAGDPNSLTLTAVGTGFSANSMVQFSGSNLATSIVSGTEITASVPSSELATSQVAQIDVFDSTQSPNTTNALPFTLLAGFSVSATPIVPSIVTPGGSASFALTLTPRPGASASSVTLQPCTIAPPTSTIACSYSSNPVGLAASAESSTVTIATTARSAILPSSPGSSPVWPLGALPWLVAVASMLAAVALARSSKRTRLAIGLALGLLLVLLVFQAACGGGGGSSGASTPATQPGTYTITVPTSPPAQNGATSVQLTVQ